MIEIYTEKLPPRFHWTPNDWLGGTPEFVINTAESAIKFDDVRVYYDGKSCEKNGVAYLPRKYFTGSDIVLACNSTPPGKGRYALMWSNWYGKKDFEYLDYDERIVQSPYHQSVFGQNSRIVPPSVHKEQYENPKKIKGLCLYSSSPDRGGMFLKGIWKRVEKETGARILYTYNRNVSEAEMAEVYKNAEFWLHPCQGIELFCISAAKAQVAGCIPVVVPNMALDTTVKYGVRTTIEKYEEDLISAIKNPPPIGSVDFGSWDSVTRDLFKAVI